MINIIINGVDVKIYDFDDGLAVLRRYVLQLGKKPQKKYPTLTLPSFLRFKNEPSTFSNGQTYEIIDIREELGGLSIGDFVDIVPKLATMYPRLDQKSIGLLWFTSNGYDRMSSSEFNQVYKEERMRIMLRKPYPKTFVNDSGTYVDVINFHEAVEKKWVDINATSSAEEKVYDQIQGIKAPDTEDFTLEETTEETFLRLPNGDSLYDIFDSIHMSRDIPFAMLVDGMQSFIKVYSDIPPPDEWVLQNTPSDAKGIYFYVLDSSPEKLLARNVQIEKLYSPGLWTDDNILRMFLKLNTDETSDELRRKIFKSLGERITYEIDETIQMGVKGKFTIPNVSFNRAVFADMILNNDVLKYFLFLDESEKSSLHKPRFTFYYEPDQKGEFSSSLTITVTPIVMESDSWVDVRISRATTMKQVQSFISIFKHIYGLYQSKEQSIIDLYKGLYSGVNFNAFEKKPPKVKQDKKTGKRLTSLKQHNPEAFSEGYSSKCQPRHRQPYLIKGDINSVEKQLKKEGGNELKENGLLNWPHGSKDWYSCYPRDSDEADKRYIWPGVIKQKESAASFSEYPFLPCCFIDNQYTKKGGNLVKYLATFKEQSDDNDEGDFDETIFDRPLGEKKLAPRGRFAELPYNLQVIVGSAGYKLIEDKRKQFLPILRYGVIRGPNSFVHVMEKATYPRYSSMDINAKIARVRKVSKRIAKMEDFSIGRQEMYDTSDEEIREHLREKGAYIDPDMYVSIFEKYYDCNIILFQVDDESPDGELVIPRHNIAYLMRKIDPKKRTAVVVKFGVPQEWQYQCELVVKYKGDRMEYLFENDDLTKILVKLMEQINTVYITSTEGKYRKYVPFVSM